ncbi:MAG: hypothetical protein N3A54_07165 [Patescibacteria group bacterium]|nr:hypothetical protein [Patescibacteria group bacterium]
MVEPIPHLRSQQIQKAGYYVGKSQITAIQDSIESYLQTSRECFDIIQSNEVLDALDFVPLRKHQNTIQELYAVFYNSRLVFFWDTPQERYQHFLQEFSSYITRRPCIYQPDVFFVVRAMIDRLSPEGSCILVDYYTHGPTPIERILNVGRNIRQKLGMPQNTPDEVYRLEGLIAAIQGLGLVDTTIRVDRKPILRACQKANVQIEIKNQWLQHLSSAESIPQKLRLLLLSHLANFSIVHITKS